MGMQGTPGGVCYTDFGGFSLTVGGDYVIYTDAYFGMLTCAIILYVV